jgi:hypothetical protein
MANVTFFYRFPVIHVSPTRTGELVTALPAEPHAGGRHTYDGVLPGAPKGIVRDTAITTSVTCKPSARCLTPWLGWTRALVAILGRYPLRDEDV